MRKCGVLMPVASLPSRFGIGGFSKEAYDFVDFLEQGGQSLWQILPLGPTGYGDSPYQSFSTFAGNPYYISLDALIEDGLLTEEECEKLLIMVIIRTISTMRKSTIPVLHCFVRLLPGLMWIRMRSIRNLLLTMLHG